MIQESRHNHHYLSRAHLSGLYRALLLPWHQRGTQVILFVVAVREEVIMRENAKSQRVIIANEDGGYESASDYDEETLALITREEHDGDDFEHETQHMARE